MNKIRESFKVLGNELEKFNEAAKEFLLTVVGMAMVYDEREEKETK